MNRNTLVAGILWILLVLIPAAALYARQGSDAGQVVFKSKCVMCHGEDGKSKTKAGEMTKSPDLTAGSWKHGTSQAEVEELLRKGAGKMPKYEGKLSAEEIRAVSSYVRQLAGVEGK